MTLGPGAIRRALFIRTDRLGETLLTLPAIAALKRALPDAALTLLVQPDLAPLLTGADGVGDIIAFAHAPREPWWREAIRLGRRLRPHRFDLVVVSNPKKELHLAAWLAGIPLRVGYGRKWGWLLTHRLADRKALGDRHEVEYNLELVRALGLPAAASGRQLPRFTREQGDVLRLLDPHGIGASTPFIAVHPWSSNPDKAWPADRYQGLIERAAGTLDMPVVLIGGPEEAKGAPSLMPEGRASVVNLVGRLSLTQLAALLERARVLVSNDSGPVHLAAAVQTRTLVLFGTAAAATGPARWGPWGRGHTVIWKPSMDAITVDEVFAALSTMLTRDG